MTRRVFLIVLAAAGAAAFLLVPPLVRGQSARTPNAAWFETQNREVNRLYLSKDYAGAAKVLDDLLDAARRTGRREIVGGILYNKACISALLGKRAEATRTARAAVEAGYGDYYKFAAETDFDAVRRDVGFRALLRDLRRKAGIAPLSWNPARTVGRFPLVMDASSLPQLVEMRREFGIDAVVAGLNDDYAKLRALATWTSRQWEHSPTAMASGPDPVTILREARAGGRFICRDYAIVLAAVARACGLPARVLNLLPRNVEKGNEAHSVAEVWLERFHKWVMADGQYGVIAEVNGVPQNGVELQAALAREDRRLVCATGAGACRGWGPFILRNAFYFKFAQDQRRFDARGGAQLVLVPSGASDPHKFAGTESAIFDGAVYISDPAAFYRRPE